MNITRFRRTFRISRIAAVLAVTSLGFVAAACEKEPLEEVGDELEDVGDAVEDAAENAGDAIKKTVDGDGR